MKIIIAGGRDFNNYILLKEKITKITENINNYQIISGKARGADSLGEIFGKEFNKEIIEFPANWEKYGKSAGYIRNEEMAKYADACICFWDGKSKGTKSMIDLARKYNLKLRIIYY